MGVPRGRRGGSRGLELLLTKVQAAEPSRSSRQRGIGQEQPRRGEVLMGGTAATREDQTASTPARQYTVRPSRAGQYKIEPTSSWRSAISAGSVTSTSTGANVSIA